MQSDGSPRTARGELLWTHFVFLLCYSSRFSLRGFEEWRALGVPWTSFAGWGVGSFG